MMFISMFFFCSYNNVIVVCFGFWFEIIVLILFGFVYNLVGVYIMFKFGWNVVVVFKIGNYYIWN